mmetsp:Transcript_6948/g.7770  ORF Transcript_6948/g.7770 Transcript_6948/m.7770 type:complete len:86 (+) Transcript_6948:75-332(+)
MGCGVSSQSPAPSTPQGVFVDHGQKVVVDPAKVKKKQDFRIVQETTKEEDSTAIASQRVLEGQLLEYGRTRGSLPSPASEVIFLE